MGTDLWEGQRGWGVEGGGVQGEPLGNVNPTLDLGVTSDPESPTPAFVKLSTSGGKSYVGWVKIKHYGFEQTGREKVIFHPANDFDGVGGLTC